MTDAVARLIEKSGADVDYLRVMKLVYLADRTAIARRGTPIVGGHYFSMRKGPTVSEVMHCVSRRNAPRWKEFISARKGNTLNLLARPSYASLSGPELEILDAVVAEHFSRSTEKLVAWCHEHCPEYVEVSWGRKPIEIESILSAENKSPDHIRRVAARAKEREEFEALLA